jgi:hypothetical protein
MITNLRRSRLHSVGFGRSPNSRFHIAEGAMRMTLQQEIFMGRKEVHRK